MLVGVCECSGARCQELTSRHGADDGIDESEL
jgi:hypothetical protein